MDDSNVFFLYYIRFKKNVFFEIFISFKNNLKALERVLNKNKLLFKKNINII